MEQEVAKWERKINFLSIKSVRMRIALCDINRDFLESIKSMIYIYAERKRLDIVVDCYFYGEDMLSANIKYNIVILGYKLAGKNGLEIAKGLRENNDFSSIIFISEYTDFVFEAFKVNAYRFLVSPVNEDQLFHLLDGYFDKFGSDYPIWIKGREDTFCLNTSDIVYLEADNKHCYVHTRDETFACNRTMARVFDVLPKNHFSKINRAYIVNLQYINRYNNDFIFLNTGEKLHISRNYYKSFKDECRIFYDPLQP